MNKKEKSVDKTTKKQLGGITGKGFMPGQSGNPNGRPKGSISITARIKQELERIPEGQQISYLEDFVNTILKKALKNQDKDMIRLIWNYVDGMPKQHIEADIFTFADAVRQIEKKEKEESG